MTSNTAEVLKLAARPTPYDNLAGVPFLAREQPHPCKPHTLYALLAALTTRRSLRLVQRVPNKKGFEVWRQLVAENAPKTGD